MVMSGFSLSRRTIVTAASALCVPMRPSAAAHAPPLDDRMQAFWPVYEDARDAALADRVARLQTEYFERQASVYARACMRRISSEGIASWLAKFDAMSVQVRAVHARLAREFAAHVGRFTSAFGDFDAALSPVFVLPSLFRFDAHLEPDGTSLPLFFGPDGIVRYHGADADLGVLLAHEIFHCYQGQKNPAMALDPKPPLFAGVWMEGCATYASERLNPGASPRQVLLDDESLERDGPKFAARAARSLLERLDSRDDEDQRAYLSLGFKGEWPDRIGYLLGLWAARRIGQRMSLQEMVALPAPAVRSELVKALSDIARS